MAPKCFEERLRYSIDLYKPHTFAKSRKSPYKMVSNRNKAKFERIVLGLTMPNMRILNNFLKNGGLIINLITDELFYMYFQATKC